MEAWAEACTEPMSLGTIHAFARMQWVWWSVRIIGTTSVPLQTFLYLCEKRRLQASRDINEDNDDKRLIEALLEDQRIAPYLLQDGRPKTVRQCIEALRNWCHLPTLDGRTLNDNSISQLETSERMKRMEVVQSISTTRYIESADMYTRIIKNNYGVTKNMYTVMSARLPVEERRNGLTDSPLGCCSELGCPFSPFCCFGCSLCCVASSSWVSANSSRVGAPIYMRSLPPPFHVLLR
jgi:hypothetical protein